MHMRTVDEPMSPIWAVWRKNGGSFKFAEEFSRRHWRKIWKRNGGRKIKTLRTHRGGRLVGEAKHVAS